MKKKNIFGIWIFALLATFILGCEDPGGGGTNRPKFDESLLIGYWQSGTLHEYYKEDGTGYTWDTEDDVMEEEAQPYTWTLSGSTLTQNHQMEMGGVVPKSYIVTTLNATTLEYHDNYGTSYIFFKDQSR
ncbi:MAG: hypothetical protein K6A41_10675 [Bacteroidales bacterium]|nr:hypothetical protein [Bacteroidales bacterium]